MNDATIEAAARALMIADVHLTQANAERVAAAFTPVIEAAVTPLIRADALEEAATRLLELAREERNLDGATINRAAEYLATLRVLTEQP